MKNKDQLKLQLLNPTENVQLTQRQRDLKTNNCTFSQRNAEEDSSAEQTRLFVDIPNMTRTSGRPIPKPSFQRSTEACLSPVCHNSCKSVPCLTLRLWQT